MESRHYRGKRGNKFMKTNKKWFISATAIAVVACAVTPMASAASFTDIEGNTHREAILALADQKIVGGYPDGTFKPNAVVTRGHVTKFLGKWLVAEKYTIPADYHVKARFTDLATTTGDKELLQYAALVKDADVFKGSNNQLLYKNNMSREQMAVVLVRAIKQVYDIDLIALYKQQNFQTALTDISQLASVESRESIIALEFASITKVTQFNPKNTVTRGQFASFLHRTIVNMAQFTSPKEQETTTNNQVKLQTLVDEGSVKLKVNPITRQLNVVIDRTKLTGDLVGKEATQLQLVVNNETFTFEENPFEKSLYQVTNLDVSEQEISTAVIMIK